MTESRRYLAGQLALLRETNPLVVNITNYVVMNNTANALLAAGASPVMAHSHEEMAEMLALSGALVINMGTLDRQWIARMKHAATLAVELGKPVVLDPVGCGSTSLRTDTARELCELLQPLGSRFTVRGNASEIMALAGELHQTKGVDSRESSEDALGAALMIHRLYGCDTVVSGATDYVVSDRVFTFSDGDPIMPSVTGMGCTFSALTGAFVALASQSDFSPALTAAAIMGVAGKRAAKTCAGPGSFQVQFLDALYQLTPTELAEQVSIGEL